MLTSLTSCKRTKLGDPSFVDHMELYQQKMLSDATIQTIRNQISDEHTLPISSYNPENLENSRRSVMDLRGMNYNTNNLQCRNSSHRDSRCLRSSSIANQHDKPRMGLSRHGTRNRTHSQQSNGRFLHSQHPQRL